MDILKKKSGILLLFIALSFLQASAQLRYGFRLGGEGSTARLSNAPGYHIVNGSGFAGGAVLEYQAKSCGLAPDIAILYGRHNMRIREDDGNPQSAGRNFIDIPIRIKYKFWLTSAKKLVGPMIYTGPVLSFRAGGEKTFYRTKAFQPGWEIGAGFDIVNFIQLSGGYRFGLGNAMADFPNNTEARLATNGWNVAATLLFDF